MLEVLVLIFILLNTSKRYIRNKGEQMFNLFKFFKLQKQCKQLVEEQPIAAVRSKKTIFLCSNSDDLFCFTNVARSMSCEEPEYFLVRKKKYGYILEITTYIEAHYAMGNEIEEKSEEVLEEQSISEEDETTKILKQKIAEKQSKEKLAKENK